MFAALLVIQAAAPVPPPGLVFGFYRMLAFQSRARASDCGASDLDRELESIRKRLAARYGKKAFEAPKVLGSPPGECAVITNVYRVNMADFRRDAAAALTVPASAAPAPAAPTKEGSF